MLQAEATGLAGAIGRRLGRGQGALTIAGAPQAQKRLRRIFSRGHALAHAEATR